MERRKSSFVFVGHYLTFPGLFATDKPKNFYACARSLCQECGQLAVSPPQRRRRARHTIMVEILKVAENGAKKTHIMYKVSVSFDQLKRYLSALEKAGFINHQYRTWKTTEKGLHVIEACELCQRLLEEAP